MRMMILALAVLLLAAPAGATVTITATHLGDKVVEISYDAESETELVRAFAVDIMVTDGNIVDIDNFAIGDDVGGYGIFPGNFSRFITVNSTTGNVDDWGAAGYTPVADGDDPGAQGGLGTPGITIEMGALYDAVENAPGKIGVLCTITVSDDCTVNLALNGMRGNVVLETAKEPLDPVDLVGCEVVTAAPDCFPSTDAAYDDWVAYGKPDCWCYARQCYGDADGKKQGSAYAGYEYVGTDDLAILINAWKIKEPDKGPGLSGNQICADFDHAKQGSAYAGYERVGTNDLAVLIDSWKVKEPDKGPGVPGDCVPVPVEPEP